MYTIRPYQTKDFDGVKDICVGLADDMWKSNPMLSEALEVVFCRYYVEKEPENCFVAVNEADEVKGYVLCAKDYDRYVKTFTADYMETSGNQAVKMMGQSTIDAMTALAGEYPAHLHIDLYPETQGQGVGRQLIETLEAHLKAQGVKGLMLDVAKDNTGAQKFYEKVGFSVLHDGDQEITMGVKLQA